MFVNNYCPLYIYTIFLYISLIVLHFVVITVFISFLIALHLITAVVNFVGLHIGGYYSFSKFRWG